ncbi:MAG: hypothetical protein AAF962_25480 [Actinomycetota bacterium]
MEQSTMQASRILPIRYRHGLLSGLPAAALVITAVGTCTADRVSTIDSVVAIVWALLALARVTLTVWGFDRRYPDERWSVVAARWAAVIVVELFLTLQLTSSYLARGDTTEPTYDRVLLTVLVAAIGTAAAVAYRWWAGRSTGRPSFAHHHLLGALALGAAFVIPVLLFAFLALFTGIAAALGVLVAGGAVAVGVILAAVRLDRRRGPEGLAAAWGRLLTLAVVALGVFTVLLAILEYLTSPS